MSTSIWTRAEQDEHIRLYKEALKKIRIQVRIRHHGWRHACPGRPHPPFSKGIRSHPPLSSPTFRGSLKNYLPTRVHDRDMAVFKRGLTMTRVEGSLRQRWHRQVRSQFHRHQRHRHVPHSVERAPDQAPRPETQGRQGHRRLDGMTVVRIVRPGSRPRADGL